MMAVTLVASDAGVRENPDNEVMRTEEGGARFREFLFEEEQAEARIQGIPNGN